VRDSDLSNGAKHDLETGRGAPHVSDNFDLQVIDSNDGMSVSLLTRSKDRHEKRVEYDRSQTCFVSSMQNVQVSTELTNSSLPLCTQVLQRGDLTSSQAGLVESTPTEVAPRSKATGPSCLNTVRHNEVLHKRCEKRHEGREDSTPSLECNEGSSDDLLGLDLDLEDIDIISLVNWCFNNRCYKEEVAREVRKIHTYRTIHVPWSPGPLVGHPLKLK
jgi:hypothetical protein